MVLHELYASGKVSLIELVRNVPPQWTKLTAFLFEKKGRVLQIYWNSNSEVNVR